MTVLSPIVLAPDAALHRDAPRPVDLRGNDYAEQFDWHTLFYDVYRVGSDVVLQGPPLRSLAAPLLAAPALRNRFGPVFARRRRVERTKGSEIWLRTADERLVLDSALGRFDVVVQPNLSHRFTGRRVLLTLSRDNEPRWIADWVRYHVAVHGADAVLLYDNASTRYTAAELEAELAATFPDLALTVVPWAYPYGPQGGLAGAVGGVETPWDSDFCQTGALQHARLRFLRQARSVLNVDIDELVVGGGGSIFAATEQARRGFIKFAGHWITSATPNGTAATDCRHADFLFRDGLEQEVCPPKWCVVPAACDDVRHSWSVHNLFGTPANREISARFVYRHFKGISTNWKYDRWAPAAAGHGSFDFHRFVADEPLREALEQAGLIPLASRTPG